MKLYIDTKTNNGNNLIGYTLYTKNGVPLANGVQIITKDTERHAFSIKAMILAVTRLKQLHDNGKLTMDKVTIFTKNTIMYNWFQSGCVPKAYKPLFDDVLHQLDWLPFEVELIVTKNVARKVKFINDIVKERDYTMTELLQEEMKNELEKLEK